MPALKKLSIADTFVNMVFLAVLNLTLMTIIGYLTLSADAGTNSRVGALLLSFFLPFFIVYKTQYMSGLERMLTFGFGFMIYIITSLLIIGLPGTFTSCLLPALVLALAVLYYGELCLQSAK